MLLRKIVTNAPFVWLIAFNSLAVATGYRLKMLLPFAAAASVMSLLNIAVARQMRIGNYFTYALSFAVILGSISMTIAPESVGQLFVEHAISFLYVALLSSAVFPPLVGLEPFTIEFSKGSYPAAIVESDQYLAINGKMNSIWIGLFALALVFSALPYATDSGLQVVISSIVPIVLLVVVGIPLNRKMPLYLMKRTPIDATRPRFDSLKELFTAMPMGLNKELARGMDAVVQFNLSGEEPMQGALSICDQKAFFAWGVHPAPKTTIEADGKLWLDISNGDVSGDWAYLNQKYSVKGDLTVLLKLADLFAPTDPEEERLQLELEAKSRAQQSKPYVYGDLRRSLKKVVIFDGGTRSDHFSKTTMMAKEFAEGARVAEADVEYIHLRKLSIKDCTGCYTCWTKTPGECIFDKTDDDMDAMRKLFREADLVVLATPLYIFSCTGLMKTFLDRTLPNLKPYMLMDKKDGHIMHPNRYADVPHQGLVVFSASGFPDVEHNFDGLRGMVRCMTSHGETQELLAEFYCPAAEMLTQPIYAERLESVKDLCFEAGKQAVATGKVDPEFQKMLADPGVSQKKFQQQADMFWETLDGKAAFLKSVPKVKASKRLLLSETELVQLAKAG